jgi:thiamine biosynthesis lipoprotein ApbE
VFLTNQALSASGTGIQGSHIVHPGGPDAMPASPSKRVWVIARSAVLAEIWSTALMLVGPRELADFIAGKRDIAQVYAERDGKAELIPSATTP